VARFEGESDAELTAVLRVLGWAPRRRSWPVDRW